MSTTGNLSSLKGKKGYCNNEEVGVPAHDNESTLPARLLTVKEVAGFLGVHPSTVRRWEKEGLVKSYVIGLRQNLRFRQEDVASFLYKCQEGGNSPAREPNSRGKK